MPRSKGKRRRYQAPPKKKHRPSSKWFGGVILFIMGLGVATIICNYLGVIPVISIDPSNWLLFAGLGLIGMGFVLATQWY